MPVCQCLLVVFVVLLGLQIFCGVRIVSDVPVVVVVGCFSGCALELRRAIVVLPVVLCVGFIFLLNLVSPTQSSLGSRL